MTYIYLSSNPTLDSQRFLNEELKLNKATTEEDKVWFCNEETEREREKRCLKAMRAVATMTK